MNQKLENIKLNEIKPNPYQPRSAFDEEKIKSLANSIKDIGLLQPIIVIKDDDGYTLVGGERRCKAHQLLGLDEIQAKVYEDVENKETFLRNGAIVENAQREELTEKEKIEAIVFLHEDQDMQMEDISKLFGKSLHWSSTRYDVFKNAPKEFVNMLYKDEIKIAWWEGIRPFLSRYSSLEKELLAAIENKRWTDKSSLREFARNCANQNLPIEIVEGIITYPTIFTKKVLEKFNEIDVSDKIVVAKDVLNLLESSSTKKVDEHDVIELIYFIKQQKEIDKKMNELNEVIKKEIVETEKLEKKLDEKFSEEEKQLEMRKNIIVLNANDEFTTSQKEELERIDQEIEKKVQQLQEEKKKRKEQVKLKIEQSQKKVFEPKPEIVELQKKWVKESYVNPLTNGINFILESLNKANIHVAEWHELNFIDVFMNMPTDEFKYTESNLDILINRLRKWSETLEKIQIYLEGSKGNLIKPIVQNEEKKPILKLVNVQKEVK